MRGHQDDKKEWHQLTWPELLNCNCDQRASVLLHSSPHRDRHTLNTLYFPHVDLLHNSIPITNNIPSTIRQLYGSSAMRTFLSQKFKWNSATCDLIDWLCHGRALSRLSLSQQTFIIKMIHEWLPLHQQKHRINYHHTNICPICQQHIETPQHFLTCAHPPYHSLSRQLLTAVRNHCDRWGSSPETKSILLHGLASLHSPNISPTHYPKIYHFLIKSQHKIGWNQLIYGRFATEWIYIHKAQTTSTNK